MAQAGAIWPRWTAGSMLVHAFMCCSSSSPCLCMWLLPRTDIWLCCAQVEDVAEAALLPFKMTGNALPLEIILQIGKDIKK